MSDLTSDELRKALATECRTRHWRVPTAKRLAKLRDAGVLPPARSIHVAGRRGSLGLYPAETVDAYVRCESARRATGGTRVRSWQRVKDTENAAAIRAWIKAPGEGSPPREAIATALDANAIALRTDPRTSQVAPFIQNPVGPDDDDTLEDQVHNAIEGAIEGFGMTGETADQYHTLFQGLTLREEDGSAAVVELEQLDPLQRRVGPFWNVMGGAASLLTVVRDFPINRLLTNPRSLLETFSDEELTDAAHALKPLIEAIARVAKNATAMTRMARSDAALTQPALGWGAYFASAASWVVKMLASDRTAFTLAGGVVVFAHLMREDPARRPVIAMLSASLDTIAKMSETYASILKGADKPI